MLTKLFNSLKEEKKEFVDEYSDTLVGTTIEATPSKKMYSTYDYQDSIQKSEQFNVLNNKVLPEDSDVFFAENFTKKGGKFVYCSNKAELFDNLTKFLTVNKLTRSFVWEQELIDVLRGEIKDTKLIFDRQYDISNTAISMCECLVCDEGNILINPFQNNPRPSRVFPNLQIIIASKDQLSVDIEHALFNFSKKYSEPFPFVIDVCNDAKNTRHVANKLVLNSQGTKNIFLFYCEETLY